MIPGHGPGREAIDRPPGPRNNRYLAPRRGCGSTVPVDDQLRNLLAELSRSLYEALAESPEVGRKLDKIRQEGYSVYLLVDGNRRGESKALTPPALPARDREPEFRIDLQDLQFLRSIGIDPTRRLKRRRSPRKNGSEES